MFFCGLGHLFGGGANTMSESVRTVGLFGVLFYYADDEDLSTATGSTARLMGMLDRSQFPPSIHSRGTALAISTWPR